MDENFQSAAMPITQPNCYNELIRLMNRSLIYLKLLSSLEPNKMSKFFRIENTVS